MSGSKNGKTQAAHISHMMRMQAMMDHANLGDHGSLLDTWHTRKSLKGKPWKLPSKPGISMENKWEFSRIDLD